MNPQISINPENPASQEARKLLQELDDYLGKLYPPESNHGLSVEELLDKSVTFLLVRVDRQPVGCGAFKLQGNGCAEVKRMFVLPSCRGLGLGKRLLSEIEGMARRAKVKTLRLETGISQPEAVGLYLREGFYEIEPFGEYQPDPLSRFFEKKLE